MLLKHGQKRSFPPGFARKSDGYFNDNNIEEKINEWRELSKKFKAEYFSLAETKQSLHTDYEKSWILMIVECTKVNLLVN